MGVFVCSTLVLGEALEACNLPDSLFIQTCMQTTHGVVHRLLFAEKQLLGAAFEGAVLAPRSKPSIKNRKSCVAARVHGLPPRFLTVITGCMWACS